MWLRLRKLDDASVCNDAGDETGAQLELAAKYSVVEAVWEVVHFQFPETRIASLNEEGRDSGPHRPMTPAKSKNLDVVLEQWR